MNLIPGTAEPALQPLPNDLSSWLKSIQEAADPERIQQNVRALPAPRNRLHAPSAMHEADEFIMHSFQALDWKAERMAFSFDNVQGTLDPANWVASTRSILYNHLEGANILATKQGEESSDAVVVFAHHDTVRESPGANDNTASVAVLIEIADLLRTQRFRKSIVLAATDMEEIGFFGGQALVDKLLLERRILGAINFETMAYTSSQPHTQNLPPGIDMLYPDQFNRIRRRGFRGEFTTLIYNGAAATLAAWIASALAEIEGEHAAILIRDPNDLPFIGKLLRRLIPGVRNFSRSDHVPFWEKGVPALMVTDTANFRYEHYHQPTDTPEKLDYQRLAAIAVATIYSIAQTAQLIY
jgi:Zn-dependent M28 family amino/carboxypeptidase